MPLMGNEFNRFFEVYWVCFGISAMGGKSHGPTADKL